MPARKTPLPEAPALPDEVAKRLLDGLAPVPATFAGMGRLRDRLLARIAEEETGIIRSQLAQAVWVPFILGVEARILYEAGGVKTWIARLAAEARVPAHFHDGVEEVLLLEGSCFLGDELMVTGDYQRGRHGSHHPEMHSVAGCLLMVRNSTAAAET